MERRKVQKTGYYTLMVSIPKSWARKMGIKKGDNLFISEEDDGTLRLTPEPGRGCRPMDEEPGGQLKEGFFEARIRYSGASLLVTIPVNLVRELGLEPGDRATFHMLKKETRDGVRPYGG